MNTSAHDGHATHPPRRWVGRRRTREQRTHGTWTEAAALTLGPGRWMFSGRGITVSARQDGQVNTLPARAGGRPNDRRHDGQAMVINGQPLSGFDSSSSRGQVSDRRPTSRRSPEVTAPALRVVYEVTRCGASVPSDLLVASTSRRSCASRTFSRNFRPWSDPRGTRASARGRHTAATGPRSSHHSLPRIRSTTQHPRTCGPSPRQCSRITSSSHPAS